ncbi:translation initiation factor IF-2 [Holosporaceae bacterium 'Namur']|nr:translation initiation factor IF-2 [Holosporaceae bacterium 'Namur']
MSDNKDQSTGKKTLTLKSGTLGLSNAGGKLGVPGGVQIKNRPAQQPVTHSKGTVVVVTKARGSTKAAPKQKVSNYGTDELDGLTLEERERRVEVLRQAEIDKKREQERIKEEEKIRLEQQELISKAKKEAEEAAANKAREEKEEEKVVVAEPEPIVERVEENISPEEQKRIAQEKQRHEEEAKKRSNELKAILLTKGKVKNLNTIGAGLKPKEEKQPETEVKKDTVAVADKETKPADTNIKPGVIIAKKKTKAEIEEEEKFTAPVKKAEPDKRVNKKLSVAQVMMMDQEDGTFRRNKSSSPFKRSKDKFKRNFDAPKDKEKVFREVILPDVISVQELANRMSEKAADVIKALMKMGMMVTLNQSIDADTAELIATEFGHKVKRVTAEDIEKSLLSEIEDSPESLKTRPPVVTVMGHVDHGKTSLLDALRSTDVVGGEAGGITQHIGAYQVKLESGHYITFLDTPGHEAFTAMRSRGAKATDIVVLVVAADDGIMQQTVEAINHAKAAEVPIIVAINKIDKPDADANRVKNELLIHGLVPEDMGGDTIVVEVSAKKRINLDKLEESILLQAEVMDLKANPNRLAKGVVIEAQVDKGRGVATTLLVQNGTLRNGDFIVAGTAYGKVKALNNDKRQRTTEAGPSTPVEVLGLNEAPIAGDEFIITANEKLSKEIAEFRINKEKERALISSRKTSLEQLFLKAKNSHFKEFNIIIKADVQGSVEAISNSLMKLSTEEIQVKLLHMGVGGITESDITLANASEAFIVGFNVRANSLARDLARKHGVEIRYYSVIYNLVDDVKAAMSGMLSPTIKEHILGYVDIKEVFDLSKFGKVAGCYVTEGMIKKQANARLIRDNVVIFDGKLKALKRFKDDVKEVRTGFECGMSFENYEDIKPGDKVEAYELIEEARTL